MADGYFLPYTLYSAKEIVVVLLTRLHYTGKQYTPWSVLIPVNHKNIENNGIVSRQVEQVDFQIEESNFGVYD